MRQLISYGIAFLGPAATAGSQFLLSLVLLRVMSPDLFGHFSFLLVLSLFSLGIWSALFSAALPVIVADHDAARREPRLATLFAANLLSMVVVVPLFAAIAWGLGLPLDTGLPFSLFAALSLLRLFARAHAYAVGQPLRVMASDLCYGLVTIAGLPLLLFADVQPGPTAATILAVSALLAVLMFGGGYLRRQFARFPEGLVQRYLEIWRTHSGWSLIGVLTTEATSNAHAYVVTLFAGPAAFAVLAASSLLTRPVNVVLIALSDFERARMARQIAARDGAALSRSLGHFRLAIGAVWLGTALVLAGVLLFVPRLVFPPEYALSTLALGSALWMTVALVRGLRAPESAMMQGAGEFRPLASASVASALVSLASVAGLLAVAPPIWSIAGVLIGDVTFAVCLWLKAWAWRKSRAMVPHPGPAPLEKAAPW